MCPSSEISNPSGHARRHVINLPGGRALGPCRPEKFRGTTGGTMHIIVLIICVILWLVIQAHLAKEGIEPRSRGSLRYQRRKARKLGVDVNDVVVRPRGSRAVPRLDLTTSLSPMPAPRPGRGTRRSPRQASPQSDELDPTVGLMKRSDWPSPIPPGWTPPEELDRESAPAPKPPPQSYAGLHKRSDWPSPIPPGWKPPE
jgi:hypothetical protein